MTAVSTHSRGEVLEYRSSIGQVGQKAQEEIDKQILTISTAALVLSLTFYKDVLREQIVVHGWLLILAWICWILAIVSVVFSMYLSSQLVRLTVKHIDNALSEAFENAKLR